MSKMKGSALCSGLSKLSTGFGAVVQSPAALHVLSKASFTCARLRAGDGEHDRERGKQNDADDSLGAELTQRDPDHERTSSFGRRSASTAWDM